MATILVVDDELGIRALLTEILSDEGHTVEAAEDAASARVLRERLQPDLVLLDIWMPDVDGITLLKEWNSAGQLTMPVIMMSGHGTIDTAVEAMKFGAAAFLEKPVTLQKLLPALEEGLNRGVDPRGAPGGGAAGLGGATAAGAGAAAGLGKAVPGHPAAAAMGLSLIHI
jgi:DNA-binding NtrC family response regulator